MCTLVGINVTWPALKSFFLMIFSQSPGGPRLLIGLGLLGMMSVSGAAEEINLDRIDPVAPTEQIPITDFFRPAYIRSPSVNRAGTHVAALVTAGTDQYSLMVIDLATGEQEFAQGGLENMNVTGYRWLTDDRLVFEFAIENRFGMGMLVGRVGSLRKAYPIYQNGGTALVSVPERNRMRPLVWVRFDHRGRDSGVVELDAKRNAGGLVNLISGAGHERLQEMFALVRESNERHVKKSYPQPKGKLWEGYLADAAGELAFGFTNDDAVKSMHYWTGDDWKRSPVDLDEIDVLQAGEARFEAIVRAPGGEGQPDVVRFMDARTGELGDLILQDKAYDFHGWFYRDPISRNITGAVFERAGPAVQWFDAGWAGLQKILDGYFPGKVVRIISHNEANNIIVVQVFSDRDPASYFTVDLVKRTLGPIKSSRPWIDAERMQRMNIMKFKTTDGRELDAYVTLPAGASKENPPPLVVLAHGGPWARDSWGFDGEAQFLASRGYAVMQPNYRGSTGYDSMFPDEDRWDFLKMHEDVTQAAKTLIESGLVDRDRVAIMGASFGGYLTLSGLVHEPELYRCGASFAGVFDWEEMVQAKKSNRYEDGWFSFLMRRIGDPDEEPQKFHDISPINFVERMQAPIFVAHGTRDRIAEAAQSKRLVTALERHGKSHEVMLTRGEGHGLAELENRVELYRRIEAFLSENL